MKYYAHSAKGSIDAQAYEVHIKNVVNRAIQFAKEIATYSCIEDKDIISDIIYDAALYHDLGKLDLENQDVLSGKNKLDHLPVNHVDAGSAFLLNNSLTFSGILVYSHHKGLPDIQEELVKQDMQFRDDQVIKKVDSELDNLILIHKQLLNDKLKKYIDISINLNRNMLLRMLLSCLVDADYMDTAINYSQYPKYQSDIRLMPQKRLAALDEYVQKIEKNKKLTPKNLLRHKMYTACKTHNTNDKICSCDSPVGSGKTTAVMAHILKQSIERKLRRVFVVLPYTSIIKQSVEVYRNALTLPGEKPNEVVAEIHHLADFENEDIQYLSVLWKAPIIVTTSVTFFETLASNKPSTLRKLHELAGSAVFVDEFHASLPVSLLPITWKWINILAEEWNCYWVLASGSLDKIWDINEIAKDYNKPIQEIVDMQLRKELFNSEKKRITYKTNTIPCNLEQLRKFILKFKGPRLVIFNTVQSAAFFADWMKTKCGDEVEHISTALTPNDRKVVIDRVIKRLKNINDDNWTLVATSCIEAGVDFSFRNGFREISSTVSLLQTAGRVNRNNLYTDSEMWSFSILDDNKFIINPGFENSAEILKKYLYEKRNIESELATQSLQDEILLNGVSKKFKELVEDETNMNFKKVAKEYRVIEESSAIAIINKDYIDKIRNKVIDWGDLQRNSLNVSEYKLKKYNCPEIYENIYFWNLGYDNFIGYMRGIVDNFDSICGGCIFT